MGRILEEEKDPKEEFYLKKYKGKLKTIGVSHEFIKEIVGINNNTKPNPKKLFMLEGIWALQKAINYDLQIEYFAFCPEMVYTKEGEKIIDEYIKRAHESFIVSKKTMSKITEKGDNPDGLVGVCILPKYSLGDIKLSENNLVVILDGLEIPGNVGTIIRTVDGVDGDGVILCNRKARLTHPKLIKSSQGSNFTVPIIEGDVLAIKKWLKENNFTIYLTDTRADEEYHEVNFSGRVAIVAGGERHGMSREWYDEEAQLLKIPMFGQCDSLNVAIATTIVLYEASLKLKGKIHR